MKKVTTIKELQEAIHALESERKVEGVRLKDAFLESYESIKPVNLIKKSIGGLASSSNFMNELVGTGLSLSAGILGKKVAMGSSHSTIRQILGTLIQMGVSTAVFRNSDAIKSMVLVLAKSFLEKRRESRQAKREAKAAEMQNGTPEKTFSNPIIEG